MGRFSGSEKLPGFFVTHFIREPNYLLAGRRGRGPDDYVVVDTAGAMDSFVREVADAATIVLIVSTGEVSSLRDTRAGLERLEKWGIPQDKIKIVLNRGSRAAGVRSGDVEEALGRPLFWEFPRDNAVPLAVQLGQPVVLSKPKAKAAQNIYALAAAISGAGKGVPPRR